MYSLYFITLQRSGTRPVTKPLRSIRPEHRGTFHTQFWLGTIYSNPYVFTFINYMCVYSLCIYIYIYIIICTRTWYTFRLLWGYTCVAWTHSFWEVVLAPKGEGERNDANVKTDYCKLEKILQFSCNEAIISARNWKFPWTTAQYSEETVLTAARLHAQSASDNQH